MVRLSRLRLNMEDGRIDRAILKDHSEIAAGSSAAVFTGAGGTYTIDIESGNTYSLILNANCSFTFSNPTGSGNACSFTLILKQDGSGRRTVTWPAAVTWMSAVTPTLATGPGDYDIFSFTTVDGGTKWFGSVAERDHLNGVGQVWAFGNYGNGRLGNNTTGFRSSPIQVGAFGSWIQMSTGWYHTTAVRSDGTLWAWGDATSGKLGHNRSDATDVSSPTQIGALVTWTTSNSGWYHSHALQSNGVGGITLWSWGLGTSGHLGTSTVVNRSSPTQVGALTDWAQVSAGGGHSHAIKTDGTLWAWGRNGNGMLGLNISTYRSSPIQIGSETWTQVVAGGFHSIGLRTNGTLWGWGGNNLGQIAIGRTGDTSSPVQIGTDSNWAQIGDGKWDTGIAIKTDGTLWTWGDNTFGQLGHSDLVVRSSPAQVGTGTSWAQVATGKYHTLALKLDGSVWAWGNGANGRLGTNTVVSRSSPTQVGTLTNWDQINGGESQTILRKFPA